MRFVDVLIRQAHPGPGVRPYRDFEQKLRDGQRYRQEEGTPWPVLVDDLEGILRNDHPWIRRYFHGPRAHAAQAARE